ncbi:MAG: DNA gyrase subunit A, partial [Thermoplasmata archaeon]|nr:DNA gyrase subunit A [Thermoplasmata archaeon]
MMKRFLLTEIQAKAILEMRLQKLTGMERQSIKDEHVELNEKIVDYKVILEDETNILSIIKDECSALKDKYGDERRTMIEENAEDLEIEDLIPVEDVVITISDTGYIKRMPLDTYKVQRRGGVGLIGMETKDEDYVVNAFVTCTHDYILFFTNLGRLYWLKAYRVPVGGRHSKGKAIINLLPRLMPDEFVRETIHVREFDDEHFVVFSSKNGKIKKTKLSAYSHVRITGVKAVKLNEGDELVEVKMTDGDKEIVIASQNGMAVRFHESEVRSMGRVAAGVRGIRLRKGDRVMSMAVVSEEDILLTLTENGFGKRTPVEQYRKIHRGGYGVITIKTDGRNGKVVKVMKVEDGDQLMVSSREGMMIRMPIDNIRIISRNTMGVRLMRLNKDEDTVMAVARMAAPEDIDEEVEIIEGQEPRALHDGDIPGLPKESEEGSEEELKEEPGTELEEESEEEPEEGSE